MKKLFCIIGPSGSGKSTYVNYIRENKNYGIIVSTTTRSPRIGEVDGQDYHFISLQEFKALDMIQEDEYAGNHYGTAQKDLDEAYHYSNYAFMVVTYEGALSFKEIFNQQHLDIEVITIFIYTPIDILKERMIKRGDSLDKVQERIDNIQKRKEYENMEKTDYIFKVNINLSIEECCHEFMEFIERIK